MNVISELEKIVGRGAFCVKLTAPVQDLLVSVKDFPVNSGKLTFPLSTRAAKALIKIARPAKFGWKDQTLLDSEVRDVWKIPKSRVKIDQRRWNKTLLPSLDDIKDQLGLPDNAVLTAYLHDMLVYEPGQFFKPHRDSEKLDGMVATLVVVLPSQHRGGTLVVDHQGEKKRLQAYSGKGNRLTLMAFYADCHHEVKPVTEGYRVTLTYNLVVNNPGKRASAITDGVAALSKVLQEYFYSPAADADAAERFSTRSRAAISKPKKWVYLLDHQYTRKSLCWTQLKGDDQPRIDALRAVASGMGLEMYLAQADIQEVWAAGESDGGYFSEWGYGWGDECDDEDGDTSTDAEYILHEMIDGGVSLRHWIDENNRPAKFAEVNVGTIEICWAKACDEFQPFASEYEPYMGNYGETLERWYHRAAVVLWRREDHYAIMCEVDPCGVADELARLAGASETLAEAQKVLRQLLPQWVYHLERTDIRAPLLKAAFTLARQIQSADMAHSVLKPLGLKALTPGTAKHLLELEAEYGTSMVVRLLRDWGQRGEQSFYGPLIASFSRLIKTIVDGAGDRDILDYLLRHQLEHCKLQLKAEKECSIVERNRTQSQRIKLTIDLLTANWYAGNKVLHEELLCCVRDDNELFPDAANVAILMHFASLMSTADFKSWGYSALLDHTIKCISDQIDNGLRAKDDWSIVVPLNCHCADCKELAAFLRSRTKREHIWPLNKQRRLHIHRQIDAAALPVLHTTRREGSPQKLILKKTNALFTQDKQRHQKLRAELKALQKIKC